MKFRLNISSQTKQSLMAESGKLLIDLSKLVFAGIILAGIMKTDANQALLFISGGLFVTMFAIGGLILIAASKSKN